MAVDFESIVVASAEIPGWTVGDDARAIAESSYDLTDGAVIVEVGVFMGRCTLLLAEPRKLRGTGKVHCVDPFDCSGDAFSIPHYRRLLTESGSGSLRQVFQANIEKHGLKDWVQVHLGTSAAVSADWPLPIDLLLLDADQSPRGARDAFEAWLPSLRVGGTIILRNTRDRVYAEGHDGHRRLAVEELKPPRFTSIRQVGATTLAVKSAQTC